MVGGSIPSAPTASDAVEVGPSTASSGRVADAVSQAALRTIRAMNLIALETSQLVPSPLFVVAALLGFAVLLAWPLVDALRQQKFLWAAAIVLFAPAGGIAWFTWRLVSRPANRMTAHA